MNSDILRRLTTSLASRYNVEGELGAGGMATVYRAHDIKHDRDVAIKVLHPDLGAALGGERFLSEIKTTAKLQHPHILPLLDSGEADGLLYYVMPLVRGETLRDRLTREHQLPIDEAILIAREIAGALQHAHAQGIIHRDIKPENVLLQDGHALVADFGIALAVQSAGGARMTQTGLSLGTPQYMSPEQAMGERTIDARSDVYALGAISYEMLTGEPPFTGATVQAIVAKVLTERPVPPHTVRDTVPVHVEQAILTALAKIPADRFATASAFAAALDSSTVSFMPSAATQTAVNAERTSRRSRFLIPVVGLLGLSLMALTWWAARRTAPAPAAWVAFTQLTDASGVETSPTLSPDGESFAYASRVRGSWDIYVQRVGGRNPVLVAGDSTADDVWPAYAPDGKRLAFARRGSGIYVVGATGESARRLTTFGTNPAWSPDGTQIVFGTEEVISPYGINSTGSLWVVDVNSGTPRRLGVSDQGDAYQPAWSPSGTRIAFWSSKKGQRDLITMAATGGARTNVMSDIDVDWAPTWSPDGKYLYFSSDRGGTMGIWRIAIDEKTGTPNGPPEPVAAGVDVDMDLPHLSADGASLLFRSKIESVNPAAISFDAANARIASVALLQHRTGHLVPSDMSPDGQWLALFNRYERQQDIFVMRPDGSELSRITDDIGRDWEPRFTPDGESLTFYSNESGGYEALKIGRDGSSRTLLTDGSGTASYVMFAPDGTRLMVGHDVKVPEVRIAVGPWPLTSARTTVVNGLQIGSGVMIPTYWSRDGRWLSGYVQLESGEVKGNALYDLSARKLRMLSNDSRGQDIAWLRGYRSVVYFGAKGELVMQDIESLQRREISGTLPFPSAAAGHLVASPDGRTLYYGALQEESNIWIVKHNTR